MDKKSGKWRPVPLKKQDERLAAKVTLEAGGGELVRVVSR